jgi:hypothetical protein
MLKMAGILSFCDYCMILGRDEAGNTNFQVRTGSSEARPHPTSTSFNLKEPSSLDDFGLQYLLTEQVGDRY